MFITLEKRNRGFSNFKVVNFLNLRFCEFFNFDEQLLLSNHFEM